jgi:tubulysin polyketide synthase-like protein
VSADELIQTCSRAGIRLAPAGDRLRVDAPRGVLTPELRDALAVHKSELITKLTRSYRYVTLPQHLHPRDPRHQAQSATLSPMWRTSSCETWIGPNAGERGTQNGVVERRRPLAFGLLQPLRRSLRVSKAAVNG